MSQLKRRWEARSIQSYFVYSVISSALVLSLLAHALIYILVIIIFAERPYLLCPPRSLLATLETVGFTTFPKGCFCRWDPELQALFSAPENTVLLSSDLHGLG